MERLRDETGKFRARTYEVTVWNNMNGDVEHFRRDATWAEVEEIQKNYDDPWLDVQIEENEW